MVIKPSHKMAVTAVLAAIGSALINAGCATSSPNLGYGVKPAGPGDSTESPASKLAPTAGHEGEVAAHGGALNAIVTCENGHAEVKKDGDHLSVWFVDGGTSSDKAVRIAAPGVDLRVAGLSSATVHRLRLAPHPLALAGEKKGDCSHFEGSAPWLANLPAFVATGQVVFKGNTCPLRIDYPKGYDPD